MTPETFAKAKALHEEVERCEHAKSKLSQMHQDVMRCKDCTGLTLDVGQGSGERRCTVGRVEISGDLTPTVVAIGINSMERHLATRIAEARVEIEAL